MTARRALPNDPVPSSRLGHAQWGAFFEKHSFCPRFSTALRSCREPQISLYAILLQISYGAQNETVKQKSPLYFTRTISKKI